jgi:hypothetical protein
VSKEFSRDFLVYKFADAFGWSESETLSHTNVRLKHLLLILDEVGREDERKMKRAK